MSRFEDAAERLHALLQEKRRLLFTLALLLIYCLYLFYPLNSYLAFSLVNGIGMYAFTVLGAFYVYYRGLRGGWALRFMLLFVLWTAISRVLSGDRVLLREGWQVAVGLLSLCFVGLGVLLTPAQRRRLLLPVALVTAVFHTAIGLMAIYVCLSRRSLLYPLTEAVTERAVDTLRLSILGQGPNSASVWFLFSSASLLYLLLRAKRRGWKLLCAAALPISFLAISGTGTRSIYLGYSFGAACLAVLLGLRYLRLRGPGRLALLAVMFALTLALVYKGFGWGFEFLNNSEITLFTGQRAAESQTPEASEAPVYHDIRGFNSSERDVLWLTVAELLREEPGRLLHGCLIEERMTRINERLGEKGIVEYKPNCHNSFVEILNYQGLPGLLLLLGFTAAVLLACLRLFFSPVHSLDMKCLILPILGIFCYSSFESLLFYEVDYRSVAFFLLTGIVLGEAREIPPRTRA